MDIRSGIYDLMVDVSDEEGKKVLGCLYCGMFRRNMDGKIPILRFF